MNILNLLIKIVLKCKILFISNNEIIVSVNDLKDKILGTAESTPSYFFKTNCLLFHCFVFS